MFRQMNVPILGIVENMSYLELPDGTRMDIFGSGGGERLAEQSGVPFIGAIPMDPAVREGGDKGVPVTISMPDSPVSQALNQVTMDVAAKISVAAVQNNDFIPITMVG
jgi:ATP-binding protein involved in chromosome partitioning